MRISYLILLVGILFAVTAQVLLKSLAGLVAYEKKWLAILLLSIAFYGLAFLSQIYLYKHFQLNKISPIMSIAIMILVVLSGTIFFKEALSTKQLFGIVMGLISIFLILN